jgi:hypothetical protein
VPDLYLALIQVTQFLGVIRRLQVHTAARYNRWDQILSILATDTVTNCHINISTINNGAKTKTGK